MDADGRNVKRLTNYHGEDTQPAWSPDGSKIVFRRELDGNRELFVMSADGSSQTNLTNSRSRDADPAWSPDGKQIAFTSSEESGPNGTYQLKVMNADGTNIRGLSTRRTAWTHPAWSKDGKIAFTAWTDDETSLQLYIIDDTGANERQLTHLGRLCSFASWSPDGDKIAFQRHGGQQSDEVWIMNADGSNPHVVAANLRPNRLIGRTAWKPR